MSGDTGRPCLLLVEGTDEEYFFTALAADLGIKNLQIENLGGKKNLLAKIKAKSQMRSFPDVKSLGIVVDADSSVANTFRSVCGALRKVKLPAPKRIGESAGVDPVVHMFVMPDNKSKGMLEDLCLCAVADDSAMQCVEDFILCVKKKRGAAFTKNISKAKIRAFLASRPTPDLALGQAAKKGYVPWKSPIFRDVISFLKKVTAAS